MSEKPFQLDFYILNSITSLDSLSEAIYRLLANYSTTYMKKIIVTTQSKE